MKSLKYIFIKHLATKLGIGTTIAIHRPKEVYFYNIQILMQFY